MRASASRAAPDDHLSSTAKSPEGSGQTSVNTLLGCAASAAHASVRSPLPRNQARPRTYQRPAPEFFTAFNSFFGSRHNRRHNTRITLIFKVILRQNVPCAMVLTGSFVLSPETRLCCLRRLRIPARRARKGRRRRSANLMPTLGHQDHTTPPSAPAALVARAHASIASRTQHS